MTFYKTSKLTLISASIALFIISFNTSATELTDLSVECTVMMSKGDFTKASVLAEAILKQDVNNSDGYLCKGRALAAQGNYQQAVPALELASKNAKTSLDAIISYTLTGNLHKQFKKYPAAINSYQSSLKISLSEKNNKYARINHTLIGETHVLNNDLNEALTSLKAADKLSDNDNERADGYEHLAATYLVMANYDKAIEFQLKAVQMQIRAGTLDQQAESSLQQGHIYTAAKEYMNAERAYTKLIQFSKDNGSVYFEAKAKLGLALTKIASGESAAAKVLIDEAKKIANDTKDKALADEIELALK